MMSWVASIVSADVVVKRKIPVPAIYCISNPSCLALNQSRYRSSCSEHFNLDSCIPDKPAVSLESTPSYLYQLHMNYTLKCKIVGFPLPQVTWFFNDCNLMNECEELKFEQIRVRYLLKGTFNFELFKTFICA